MKKTTFPLILALITLFAGISSCKKTDGGTSNSKITFTISGTNYSYPSSDGMLATPSANLVTVTSADAANSSNQFILRMPNTAGTYAFIGTSALEWIVNGKVYSTNPSANAGSGTIAITGSTSTVSFTNVPLYNTSNPSDSVVITTGAYSGKYY